MKTAIGLLVIFLTFPVFCSTPEEALNFREGADWKTFRFEYNIKSGSALDFSGFSGDAPAGAKGKLTVRNGKFVFEKQPDRPVRFFGGNVCDEGCVMTDEELTYYPARMKALGYNAIRFHHFDELLVEPGTELRFNKKNLDRFFKTFAAFKKMGMYVTLDLYTKRLNGLGYPCKSTFQAKCMALIDPAAKRNMIEFAKTILATKNPYTGMSLAEDPALITVGLINEPFLIHPVLRYNSYLETLREPLNAAFRTWCKKNNRTFTEKPSQELWTHFMMDLGVDVYNWYKNELKNIGVTVPIGHLSNKHHSILALPRSRQDYYDMHWYYDHPVVSPGFKAPFRFHNRSSMENFVMSHILPASERPFGMPALITEWKYCSPNMYRSEGGVVGGAFAGLQDYDGIFIFSPIAYFRKWGGLQTDSRKLPNFFSVFTDPIERMNNYILACLFGRGDVRPSDQTFTLNLSKKLWENQDALACHTYGEKRLKSFIPREFIALGTVRKLGIQLTDSPQNRENEFSIKDLTANTFNGDDLRLLKEKKLIRNGIITSSTGEIQLSPQKKEFRVITPRSEGLVQESDSNQGKLLEVRNNTCFSTVFATSLDDKMLKDSHRILLIYMTDVKARDQKLTLADPQKERYNLSFYPWISLPSKNPDHRGLCQYTYGKYPLLVRKGSADIRLKLAEKRKSHLYALDLSGNRIMKLPLKMTGNILTFQVSTDTNTNTLAYELVRE